MTDPRVNRAGDRLFQRLFREITRFRFVDGDRAVVVVADTEVWFHAGSAIVQCNAIQLVIGAPTASALFPFDPYTVSEPASTPDPTGETIRRNMVHSSAIRLGVAAHDHLLEKVRAVIPETAERVS